MRSIRRLAVLLVAGLWPLASLADIDAFFTPPAGWTSVIRSDGWLVQSPQTTGGTVSFIMVPVAEVTGDFAQTFATDIPVIVSDSFGEIVDSSPVTAITKLLDPGEVLSSTLVVQTADGARARVQVIGYLLPEGGQFVFVVSPEAFPADSPLITDAIDFSEGIRMQKFALTAERLAEATGEGGAADGSTPTASSDGSAKPGCRIERVMVNTSRYERYNCVLSPGSFFPVCQTRYIPGIAHEDREVCD